MNEIITILKTKVTARKSRPNTKETCCVMAEINPPEQN